MTNQEQEILLFEGKFTKILSGGQKADWKYTFALFKTKNDLIPVYLKNQSIDFVTSYLIECNFNSQRNTYNLISLEVLKMSEMELESIVVHEVKGLGPKTITKIKEKYGVDWLKNIENNDYYSDILKEKVVEELKLFLEKFNNETYSFFVSKGLTLLYEKIKQILNKNNFLEELKNTNVYDLYFNFGITFNEIHKLAISLYADNFNELKRDWILQSVILYYFDLTFMNNSTLIPYKIDELEEFVNRYIACNIEWINNTVAKLVAQGDLIFYDELQKLTTTKIFKKEENILNSLIKINKKNSFIVPKNKPNNLSLKQEQAFMQAMESSVSIISGFPGTGKSYLISKIFEELSNHYSEKKIQVLTPTGKAAVNLITSKNIDARTIHSFLKIKDAEELNFIDTNEKDVEVLIIDEFSMVEINLFNFLLNSCPKLKKIILLGDAYQLPCIGPGNLLEDLINVEIFNTTILDEIYRTDKKDIVDYFLDIKSNKFPQLSSESVKFEELEIGKYSTNITKYYSQKVAEYGIDNVMVLIPINSLIDETNKILQKWYIDNYYPNSVSYPVFFNNGELFLNDKVIQIVNNYDKDVFNGEIGYFIGLNDAGNFIIDFNSKHVEYELKEIKENLKLAYAISVHKFQGSEAVSIIFPVFSKYKHMLNNKLIYTATSRAKEDLLILGNLHLYKTQIEDKNNNLNIETNLQILGKNIKNK
ncbi:ATP-dependent DNA helicase [Mycoplasmopsis columbina]|uniref:ATP-dependent DNA helicase n=1 Tax=Mycoplasmopsis columbina TaxID=114881 RepID=UPI0004A6E2E2|nr:AAA family ATPase [Mycoplasmopsis columbina]VEU77204.1 exodeoxyribonuclease V C-terminal fragment [Mycoplasmopsis columbina]